MTDVQTEAAIDQLIEYRLAPLRERIEALERDAQAQESKQPMPLEKPDGWIVRNRTGGVELFLDHERATAAFSAWGSSIGPLYAGPHTRPLRPEAAQLPTPQDPETANG